MGAVARTEVGAPQTVLEKLCPARIRVSDRWRDPLFLFACYLEWHNRRSVAAYHELIAALDDPSDGIRLVAEVLLSRSSARLEPNEVGSRAW